MSRCKSKVHGLPCEVASLTGKSMPCATSFKATEEHTSRLNGCDSARKMQAISQRTSNMRRLSHK